MSIVYDIIIIGSGMSGLYSAYNIQQMSPKTSFLILEKYKREWIGGRTSNDIFYGTQIVTGAGIGRKDTNPLLIGLMNELNIKYTEYNSVINYSKTFNPVDIIKILKKLKSEYKKHPELHNKTFREFCIKILGNDLYKQFTISSGYTDYENADIGETLYNYGMEDNTGGWTGLRIPWKKMVETLYHKIGKTHFKFSTNVVSINKVREKPCLFHIESEKGTIYQCNKVIIATTISGIKNLLPSKSIYNEIHGQPFLRLYGKFDKKSSELMKQFVTTYTIVPGPLQKIIPINPDNGIYMISYSDNDMALSLKDHLNNNIHNRVLLCRVIEKSLGIQYGSLHLTAIKDYYWPIGTHYYEPLKNNYKNRNEFVYEAQHPEKGMLVVGEAVSRYQGWTEGALESVEAVLTKKWVEKEC
jgi:hypothetical protein